ncbi:hypothetical protein CEXT_771141 [Caerostris extrusa]|uniref:Uncharacterized protein n=1 Tax=Caerostris extrusa TaxID=172846 RepID=A0AAV4PSK8_CAEEX|nr:hypothetical protein CEXT_771141 [Caerostris extrusa]
MGRASSSRARYYCALDKQDPLRRRRKRAERPPFYSRVSTAGRVTDTLYTCESTAFYHLYVDFHTFPFKVIGLLKKRGISNTVCRKERADVPTCNDPKKQWQPTLSDVGRFGKHSACVRRAQEDSEKVNALHHQKHSAAEWNTIDRQNGY